jgi:hypothetical protein
MAATASQFAFSRPSTKLTLSAPFRSRRAEVNPEGGSPWSVSRRRVRPLAASRSQRTAMRQRRVLRSLDKAIQLDALVVRRCCRRSAGSPPSRQEMRSSPMIQAPRSCSGRPGVLFSRRNASSQLSESSCDPISAVSRQDSLEGTCVGARQYRQPAPVAPVGERRTTYYSDLGRGESGCGNASSCSTARQQHEGCVVVFP